MVETIKITYFWKTFTKPKIQICPSLEYKKWWIMVLNHPISKNIDFSTSHIHKMTIRNILIFIIFLILLINMVSWCQYLDSCAISAYVFLYFLKRHEKLALKICSPFVGGTYKVGPKIKDMCFLFFKVSPPPQITSCCRLSK